MQKIKVQKMLFAIHKGANSFLFNSFGFPKVIIITYK